MAADVPITHLHRGKFISRISDKKSIEKGKRGASVSIDPNSSLSRRRGLATKFFVSTGLVLLGVFAIVTLVSRSLTDASLAETVSAANAMIREMTDEQASAAQLDVERKAERLTSLFSSFTAQAIADLDLAMLAQLAKLATEDPDILFVEFKDKSGRVLASAGKVESNGLQRSSDIQISDVLLGHVRIGYTFERSNTSMRALMVRGSERTGAIDVANTKSLNRLTILSMLSSAIAAALIGFACAQLVARYVRRPLHHIMDVAARLAEGDLRARVSIASNDEMELLARSFNAVAGRFCDAISGVQQSSQVLASTAMEVATITDQSSQGLVAQEREIGLVATAMAEMNATVSNVSQGAQRAAQFAGQVSREAAKGKSVVDATVEMINAASRESERSAAVVQELGAHSQTIGSVVDVIKSIAEQTNLLALNASIEAARAGEQGRGFAVVADEVRVLAKRTQQSTSEIERMIGKLQVGARDAVQAMEVGRAQVGRSAEQARGAGASLEVILKGITEISDVNNQIASSSEEQLTVVEELHRSVSSISRVAEETAKGALQTAQAAEGLDRTAHDLTGLVSHFKI